TGAPAFLSLPTDYPRPPVQTFNGQVYRFQIGTELVDNLHELCRQQNITLYMAVLAAFNVLLYRYSGQEDICVGSPIAGRNIDKTEDLIGFFVNAIVMRSKINDNMTGVEFLKSVRDTALSGFAHQEIPFELLVETLQPERNLSYPPIAQVGFALQNVPTADLTLPGVEVEPLKLDNGTAKYDMILMLTESEGLVGELEFNTDLFKPETVQQMMVHFERLLQHFVDKPEAEIEQYRFVSIDELYQDLSIEAEQYMAAMPLTTMQRDIFVACTLAPDNINHSIGYILDLPMAIDEETWKKAIAQVHDDQPVLRVQLKASTAPYLATAYQCVSNDSVFEYDVFDCRRGSADIDKIYQQSSDFIYRPYAIGEGPLIRHQVYLLKDRTVIAMGIHHVMLDGIGVRVYAQQLCWTYEALMQGKQYHSIDCLFREYVEQNAARFDREETLRYWKNATANVEPLDFVPLAVEQGKTVEEEQLIDGEFWLEVKKVCRRQRMTPALLLKAIYGIVLKEYCRTSSDFVVYELLSGRVKKHNSTLGCYYQQVPVIFPNHLLQDDTPIGDYFTHVKQFVRTLGSKQDISNFAQQQAIPQGRLKFSYNFFELADDIKLKHSDVSIKTIQRNAQVGEQDILFIIKTLDDGLMLSLRFNDANFSSLDLLPRFKQLLEQFVAGVTTVGDFDLLLNDEATPEQWSWNGGINPQDSTFATVHQGFEAQVQKTPDAIATQMPGVAYSYAVLNEKANTLSHYLLNQGLQPESAVGICIEPSPDVLVAILAVLKAGGAYVPIDPEYPVARIQFIVEDTQSSLILAQLSLQEKADRVLASQSACLCR
ncbi:MAG: AMP-binding protein, partial [Methylococcales bacterium]|nr:AMP-binding protein [Methylococcales bacterium]